MALDDTVDVSLSTAEFHLLRPLCILVIKDPTPLNFQNLTAALKKLSDPPQHLAQYVLLPLVIHLRKLQQLRDSQKVALITTIDEFCSKFDLDSWEVFIELFQRLHLAIGMQSDPTKVNPTTPEDLIKILVNCISIITKKNLKTHSKTLFSEAKMQILAHSVFLLLQLAEADVLKSIRLQSLSIIHNYAQLCSGKKEESQTLFKFLPGIVSSLKKIVDVRIMRASGELIEKGLELMAEVIIISTEFTYESELEATDIRLSAIISEISKELLISEEILKMSLLNLTIRLFENTEGKLPHLHKSLLSNLMTLKSDCSPSVASLASSLIPTDSINVTPTELLELTTKTIEQLSSDSTTNLSKLNSLISFVNLNYFELEQFSEQLFSLLIQINMEYLKSPEESRKESSAMKLCSRIVRGLSKKNLYDLIEIIEAKFARFHGQINSNFLGAVLCFNELISEIDSLDLFRFAEYYIFILASHNTSLILQVLTKESPKTNQTIDIQNSVLIQGLYLMSKNEELIPTTLYTLVEFAGANNSTALNALNSLSDNQIEKFLQQNLETILTQLQVKILNISMHPNAPNALALLAQYFDFSKLSLIDLVESVLSRSCDPYHGGNLQFLFSRVFYAFTHSIYVHTIFIEEESKNQFLSHTKLKRVNFLEFIDGYEASLGLNEESRKENSEESEETTQNPEETKLSPSVQLIQKICSRVLNFLPNSDRAVQLLAMDVLIEGMELLKAEEDVLLPLAHTIWGNLVGRLTSNDYVTVRKSFKLLQSLCVTCGSFLKKRTLEEIFPKLSQMLSTLGQQSEAVKDKNRKYYTYTQAYKLQMTVLEGLSSLCQSIDIQEEELQAVIDGCIYYLKAEQHGNLKYEASKLIESLTCESSCSRYRSVWMKLIKFGVKPVPNCPHSEFTKIPDFKL